MEHYLLYSIYCTKSAISMQFLIVLIDTFESSLEQEYFTVCDSFSFSITKDMEGHVECIALWETVFCTFYTVCCVISRSFWHM